MGTGPRQAGKGAMGGEVLLPGSLLQKQEGREVREGGERGGRAGPLLEDRGKVNSDPSIQPQRDKDPHCLQWVTALFSALKG